MDMLAVTMGAHFHIIKFKKATTWLVMYRNEVFNFGYNIIFVFFKWPPARDFFLSVSVKCLHTPAGRNCRENKPHSGSSAEVQHPGT